jgi:hypothetical protein
MGPYDIRPPGRRRAPRDDDVSVESQTLGGHGGKSLELAIRVQAVDGDGLLFHVA